MTVKPPFPPSCADIKQAFSSQGVLGPIRVLTPAECVLMDAYVDSGEIRDPTTWHKGYACSDPLIYAIATKQNVLDVVERLLGPDLYLWGASIIIRKPGEAHHWHTDIETSDMKGRFVSVWIGISNTSLKSGLQFIEESHLIGMPLQGAAALLGVSRPERSAEMSLAMAKRHRSGCSLSKKAIQDGEAFFFDGRIWHGSLNAGDLTRKALLLQYAANASAVRIPNFEKLDYPFEFTNKYPPAVVVRGRRRGVKNVVGPPSRVRKLSHEWLSEIRPDKSEQPWTPYHLFRGATACVDTLNAHFSVLQPGHCPHPPHKHIEEEFLIVIDGIAQVIVGNDMITHTVKSGDFAYYPAYYAHTIRNESNRPVIYLMLKWQGAPLGFESHVEAGIFLDPGSISNSADTDFSTKLTFEGPTHFLRKLHVHRSYVLQGGGYAPHEDEYDVFIILLDGALSTMGKTIEAPALLYHPAGTSHGLRSFGERAACYVVVEMHGMRNGYDEHQSIISKFNRAPHQFERFLRHHFRQWIPGHVRQRIKKIAPWITR